MKILVDTIYTSKASTCASAYKMKVVVEHLLETTDDTFFRWLIPDWMPDSEFDWFPNSPRVEYLRIAGFKDRHKEYQYPREDWIKSYMFRGDYWDTDVVLTNRSPLAPLIRTNMYRPGHHTFGWSRKIVLFEDMPVMSFKGSVPIAYPPVQDRQTIAGYLAADATAICAYWEKEEVLQIARKWFAPSAIRQLVGTMHEASPIEVKEVKFKSDEFVQSQNKPFVIGFAGRMVKGHNFDAIFEVMEKHWVYRGGNSRAVECVISTVSNGSGVVDVPDFVTLKKLGREDFWDLMRNKVDIGIFMSPEEDYSLSLLEPLILGTPYVVYKCKWSVASLGEDYPFYCSNVLEAYGLIREFYLNYQAQYDKFKAWSTTSFFHILMQRNEVTHVKVVDSVLREYRMELSAHWDGLPDTPKDIVALLIEYGKAHGGKINLKEAITDLQTSGKVRHLANKFTVEFQERISLSFSTDFNEFRLALGKYGYVDTSVSAGDLGLPE